LFFNLLHATKNVQIEPLGKGHINDSYKVTSNDGEYVLQRINHHIFRNVEQLQNNIFRVTSHIRAKLEEQGVADVNRRVLTLLRTHDGALFYRDDNGEYWRMMSYHRE